MRRLVGVSRPPFGTGHALITGIDECVFRAIALAEFSLMQDRAHRCLVCGSFHAWVEQERKCPLGGCHACAKKLLNPWNILKNEGISDTLRPTEY